MKYLFRLSALCLCYLVAICLHAEEGIMKSWQTHLAYGNVTEIANAGNTLYAMAGGSLFSIDKSSEELAYYSKTDGLNGSSICHIAYCEPKGQLVIFYDDGMIDIIDQNAVIGISDLAIKQMNVSKTANSILPDGNIMYMAMPFGIMVLNVAKKEIADTYYIGPDGKEENILQIALHGNRIYAASSSRLYYADRKDNLLDFSNWHSVTNLPYADQLTHAASYNDSLYILCNQRLFVQRQQGFVAVDTTLRFQSIRFNNKQLFCLGERGAYTINVQGKLEFIALNATVQDALKSNSTYWFATRDGIIRYTNGDTQYFHPVGPTLNLPYRIKIANQKLYAVPGARWASQENRPGDVMIYDCVRNDWTNIVYDTICQQAGVMALDLMNVAVDPKKPDHFFVTGYGSGLYEFNGADNRYRVQKWYNHHNSPLVTLVQGYEEYMYIRTDGALYDADGNLWVINVGGDPKNIHIIQPSDLDKAHQKDSSGWFAMNLTDHNTRQRIVIQTPQEMFIDNRYSNWKWIPIGRSTPGLVLLDDNQTPFNAKDDISVYRGTFVDQDRNTLSVSAVYSAVQDKKGTIWVGMDAGILTIPSTVDFRTSNACERIKIPRNDGTNLADYLLETERINAIAVDGANRKWIGTEGSGLYLMSEDGTETVEHFTADNSALPSNTILSIAIEPVSGRVFVGTAKGLVSYQSDAATPSDTYTNAYAYPNPVRPDYDGLITVTGLMDNTLVHIVDNGGNLVCETRSNGGLAVWDGKNGHGQRVSTGVYTVLCNTAEGNHHAAVKILVL